MAVNVDPRESDLRSVPNELLDRWQAATNAARDGVTPSQMQLGSEEAEAEWHPLAPWLLALAAALLLVESLVANIGTLAPQISGALRSRRHFRAMLRGLRRAEVPAHVAVGTVHGNALQRLATWLGFADGRRRTMP